MSELGQQRMNLAASPKTTAMRQDLKFDTTLRSLTPIKR
jgi:hypothetical protein